MILATIGTQEKVPMLKNNAITWKVVNIIKILLLEKNGVTLSILVLVRKCQEKTGVQKNSNGMATNLKKAVMMLASDMFLAI